MCLNTLIGGEAGVFKLDLIVKGETDQCNDECNDKCDDEIPKHIRGEGGSQKLMSATN